MTLLPNSPSTGSQDNRFFEIREAADGFSLFTWRNDDDRKGSTQWKENHELDWEDAHRAALAWIRKDVLPIGDARPLTRTEKDRKDHHEI